MDNKEYKNFSDFINVYSIPKTLRFELKPIGETEILLGENEIIQKDKIRFEKYKKLKPFLDSFHRGFIDFCLLEKNILDIHFSDYEKSFFDYEKSKKLYNESKKDVRSNDTKEKNSKKNEKKEAKAEYAEAKKKMNIAKEIFNKAEKALKEEEKNLRTKITELFNTKSIEFIKQFGGKIGEKNQKKNTTDIIFKKGNYNFLFEEGIFLLMKEYFNGDGNIYITDNETGEILKNENTGNDMTIFDDWKGYLGYFDKFFETRKNFYKNGGKSGAIATRIIDENLIKFYKNISTYKKMKDKINFDALEKDFAFKENNITLEQIFSGGYYKNCFLQNGIDFYNKIIGGITTENGDKIKGLNEYINEYKQKRKKESKNKENTSGEKIYNFIELDKQILSARNDNFIEQISDNNELLEILNNFYSASVKRKNILEYIFENLCNYTDEDYKTIYITKKAFNNFPYQYTNNGQFFEELVYNELLQGGVVKKRSKSDIACGKYTFPSFIPLFYIKKGLKGYPKDTYLYRERYYKDVEGNKEGILEKNDTDLWKQFCDILKFEFNSIFSRKIILTGGEEKEIGFNLAKNELENILKNFSINDDTKKNIEKLISNDNKKIIKDFADETLKIYQMGNYFSLETKKEGEKIFDQCYDFYYGDKTEENKKYGYMEFSNNGYEEIIHPYNLIRNFLTKKPWADDKKWILYFDYAKLLKGFSESKTNKSDNGTQYGAYIFRRKNSTGSYTYLLGVSKNVRLFRKDYEIGEHEELTNIERLHYFQILSKSIYGSSYKGTLKDDINKISTGDISENYVIQKIKDALSSYSSIEVFRKIINKTFTSIKQIQNSIDAAINTDGKQMEYKKVTKKQYEETKKSKDPFYLFEIHSKDLYLQDSKKNLHSLYLLELLKGDHKIIDLGTGEIFFRPKTDVKKLGTKMDNNNKEVIDHKRYVENKILFHLSIMLNNGGDDLSKQNNFSYIFNKTINNFLANNDYINVIGIDRGEKHLGYFNVLNQKGEILESGSLNYIYQYDNDGKIIQKKEKKILEIHDEKGEIIDYELQETGNIIDYKDYGILLEYKEKKRRLQRQSWKEIEEIKDLKKGYISFVVRKISDLIIKYNAIVIFEDLNMRFKQIRGGIERSVYQQIEKALINKLNFLVNKKEMDPIKAGHLLKAYQLTAPIKTFKDMGSQTGIIFYTQASYTSKIDPVTGWRPNLYLKIEKAEKNKENILKFDNIVWDNVKKRFEFTYDLKKFKSTEKNIVFPEKTLWIVCSSVERYKWKRDKSNNNKGGYEHYESLTDNFKNLFKNYGININVNIKEEIEKLPEKGNEKFFSEFIHLFKLVCQIRNTNKDKKGDENDFILSPVEPFFDSRRSEEFGKNLPKNGDDNGAYNIARKGIIILDKISEWKKENEQLVGEGKKEIPPDIFISHADWDNFATKNTNIKK